MCGGAARAVLLTTIEGGTKLFKPLKRRTAGMLPTWQGPNYWEQVGLNLVLDQPMPAILTSARVGQCICSRVGQPQRVVQFAIGKQSSIGGNRRTAKLEHQATIKIEPQRTSIRFTRRVRHYYPGAPSITR